MSGVEPTKHPILLVGPRVIHLKPFFERRRYPVHAEAKGVDGMTALDAERRDVVILELNLGDLTATEFLMAARSTHPHASFLLLDDPSKANQIVKALQAGLDGYLATPPDEDRLFYEVERQLRQDANAVTSTLLARIGDSTELQTATEGLKGELDVIREERAAADAARRALKAQVEELRARLEEATKPKPVSAEGAAVRERAQELEADNMVQAGRIAELEDELAAANAARETSTTQHAKRVAELEAQLAEALASAKSAHDAAAAQAARRLRAVEDERDRFASERDEALAAIEQAMTDRDAAVEKALDIELASDELNNTIERLRAAVAAETERATRAEADFKREKLRLIEEKEAAFGGSQDAFARAQKFIEENAALKRRNAELEAMREQLEAEARKGNEQARAAEGTLAETTLVRAEALEQRDSAEQARRGALERLEAIERDLGARVAALGHELEQERARAAATSSQAEALVGELRARAAKLEDRALESDARERETREALEQARAEAEDARRALADVEARRAADALIAGPTLDTDERETNPELTHKIRNLVAAHSIADEADSQTREREAIAAERDAYRARLAETEAWVQQAQLHLQALRTEREQLAAQAAALEGDVHARTAEAQELYKQLANAKAHVQALTGRAAGLEQELTLTRVGQVRGAPPLPDELEPLRWTLSAAIDALALLEQREPALAAHLRNLRLLASTLHKLGTAA